MYFFAKKIEQSTLAFIDIVKVNRRILRLLNVYNHSCSAFDSLFFFHVSQLILCRFVSLELCQKLI